MQVPDLTDVTGDAAGQQQRSWWQERRSLATSQTGFLLDCRISAGVGAERDQRVGQGKLASIGVPRGTLARAIVDRS